MVLCFKNIKNVEDGGKYILPLLAQKLKKSANSFPDLCLVILFSKNDEILLVYGSPNFYKLSKSDEISIDLTNMQLLKTNKKQKIL